MRRRGPWCRLQSCPRNWSRNWGQTRISAAWSNFESDPNFSVRHRAASRVLPSSRSHQIHERQQRHPDDVERMPEQAETQKAPKHEIARALYGRLRHHEGEPEQACGDMRTVQTDQAEKSREE